jgi:predicted Zn-dependent protease
MGWRIALLSCALQAFGFAQGPKPDVIAQSSMLVRAGRVDQAEALLRSATGAHPDSARLHGALGDLLLQEHKYEDSVMELGRAAQLEPGSRKYNLLAAEALIGWQRYPTAVDFLNAIQPRFGKDPHFHYVLGLAYYYEHNWKAAIPQLEEAVRLSPKYGRARFLLANCLLVNGKPEKALAILRELAKEQPDKAFYWASLGQNLGYANTGGSADEALQAVLRALALAPKDSYVQFVAAAIFTNTGRYAEARPLLENLEKSAPGVLEIHTILVRVYARLGEHDLARKEAQIVDDMQKREMAEHPSATPPEDANKSPDEP